MTDAPGIAARSGTHEGMRYEVLGAGPPLVALHGFGEHSFAWRYLAPVLAQSREVHLLDLLGHGHAEKPRHGDYSPTGHARRVASYIDAKRLERPVLMGHSMGGGVALIAAIDRVDRGLPPPTALLLVDSMFHGMRVPAFIAALRIPGLAQLATGLVPVRLSTQIILRQAIHDPSKITREMVEAYAWPLTSKGGRNAIIQTARQITNEDGAAYAKRIGEIQAPCLVLWGRNDRIAPLAVGEKLQKALPYAKLHVVDNCGHCPNEEQPEAAITAVTGFLANLP